MGTKIAQEEMGRALASSKGLACGDWSLRSWAAWSAIFWTTDCWKRNRRHAATTDGVPARPGSHLPCGKCLRVRTQRRGWQAWARTGSWRSGVRDADGHSVGICARDPHACRCAFAPTGNQRAQQGLLQGGTWRGGGEQAPRLASRRASWASLASRSGGRMALGAQGGRRGAAVRYDWVRYD